MSTTTTRPAEQDAEQRAVQLTAFDVMTSDLATVLSTTTVGEAIALMRHMGIRHLPVLGDGRFVGIVDDRLVAFAMLSASGTTREVLEQPVGSAMTSYVPQVAPDESVQRVAHLLRTSRCDAVVVIDAQEHLLGIITMVDLVTTVVLGTAGVSVTASAAGRPPPILAASSGAVAVTAPQS